MTLTVGNAGITTLTRRLDVLPGDISDDGAVTLGPGTGPQRHQPALQRPGRHQRQRGGDDRRLPRWCASSWAPNCPDRGRAEGRTQPPAPAQAFAGRQTAEQAGKSGPNPEQNSRKARVQERPGQLDRMDQGKLMKSTTTLVTLAALAALAPHPARAALRLHGDALKRHHRRHRRLRYRPSGHGRLLPGRRVHLRLNAPTASGVDLHSVTMNTASPCIFSRRLLGAPAEQPAPGA